MLSSSISPLQIQEAVHIPNSLQKLISQIQCPAKKRKMLENNPLQIRRIKHSDEGNKFAKLYMEPNRKDAVQKKHKNGSWMPPPKSNDESSETNYSQLPNKINDHKTEFPTNSFLLPADSQCPDNHCGSTSKHPEEVDRFAGGNNSFKYPMQEITKGTKSEARFNLGSKRIEHTSNADAFVNDYSLKSDTEFALEQKQQMSLSNTRKTPTAFPTIDDTETTYSEVEHHLDSNGVTTHEFNKPEHDFKMLSSVADNAIKSSIKTNFNNRKKWVTFNDIIEKDCEQNFVDELYDENSDSRAKDEPENAEFSKLADNEHLGSDVRSQDAYDAVANTSIPTRTDQQKLSDLIQQVQRMNELITKARSEILKFGYAPSK